MSRGIEFLIILCFIITLSACCTLECVGPVDRNIKPYLHYWEKSGVRAEQRLADGTRCGGGYKEPNMPSFSKEAISVARLAGGKDDNQAYSQLFHDWERCMLKKGYRYTGNCDAETPACDAL